MHFQPSDSFHNGKYQLIELIGQGAHADVWSATEIKLNRIVVLKMLRESFFAPDSRYRFEIGARALARLDHSSVVKLYGSELSAEGVLFLALEYGGNKTLLDCIEGECRVFNSLDVHNLTLKLKEVACGLAAIHAAGIIHRDIKPNNILWDGNTFKICDFGMASIDDSPGMTVEGQFIGNLVTPAPEQFGSNCVLTTETDVYNLGGAIYAAFTRKSFYGSDNFFSVQNSAVVGSRSWSPEFKKLPKSLRAIISKMMQYDALARYPSAIEACADFNRFINGEHVEAELERTHEVVLRWIKHNPWPAALFAVLLLFATNLYRGSVEAFRTSTQTQQVLKSFDGVLASMDNLQPVTQEKSQTTILSDLNAALKGAVDIDDELQAELYYNLGARYLYLDAFFDAEEAFSASLALRDDDIARINRAWCLREIGHVYGAESHLGHKCLGSSGGSVCIEPLDPSKAQQSQQAYDFARDELSLICNRDYPSGDPHQDYIILFARNRYAALQLESDLMTDANQALETFQFIDSELQQREDIEAWLWPVNTGNLATAYARPNNGQNREMSLAHHELAEQRFLAAGMALHPEMTYAYYGQALLQMALGNYQVGLELLRDTIKHRSEIGLGHTPMYLGFLNDLRNWLIKSGDDSDEEEIRQLEAEIKERKESPLMEGKAPKTLVIESQ
ncbi:MAG: serine/threonine protein kinase [Planctomycetes bacterium]|nr:serine/threonine protein kinase [Planctomycetota bacterium]